MSLCFLVVKISSIPKSQSEKKDESSTSGCIFLLLLNKHKHGYESQSVFRVLKIRMLLLPKTSVCILFLYIYDFILNESNSGSSMRPSDQSRTIFQVKIYIR